MEEGTAVDLRIEIRQTESGRRRGGGRAPRFYHCAEGREAEGMLTKNQKQWETFLEERKGGSSFRVLDLRSPWMVD
jgi:hypothetical protein